MFDCVLFKDPTSTKLFYSFITELRNSILDVKETTTTHKFIRTLADTGRLLRCYTQNIDGLEARVGLTTDMKLGKGKRRTLGGKLAGVVGLPESEEDKGCQVVQLHGDLDVLRCTLCQQQVNYDNDKVNTLLEGSPPECPLCQEKDDIRTNAGKRSLQVGTLRPNIVLYGEENPQAEMIGKITTADLSARPDYLIIAGTSLKVHGLKNIVRCFAASVHNKKGKVIFVNKTPGCLASSVWKETIDYYVEMDCDSFVDALKAERPDICEKQTLLDMARLKSTKSVGGGGKKRKSTLISSDNSVDSGVSFCSAISANSTSSASTDKSSEESDKENVERGPQKKRQKLMDAVGTAVGKIRNKIGNGKAKGTAKPKAKAVPKKKALAESNQGPTPPTSEGEKTPSRHRKPAPKKAQPVPNTPSRKFEIHLPARTPQRKIITPSKLRSTTRPNTTAAPLTPESSQGLPEFSFNSPPFSPLTPTPSEFFEEDSDTIRVLSTPCTRTSRKCSSILPPLPVKEESKLSGFGDLTKEDKKREEADALASARQLRSESVQVPETVQDTEPVPSQSDRRRSARVSRPSEKALARADSRMSIGSICN